MNLPKGAREPIFKEGGAKYVLKVTATVAVIAFAQYAWEHRDAAPASHAQTPYADQKWMVPGQATELMKAYVSASTACNQRARSALKIIDGDPLAAYRDVREVQDICNETATVVGRLEAPMSADQTTQASFTEILRNCRDSHRLQARAYGRLGKVIDGEQQPSYLLETRDLLGQAEDGLELCRYAMTEAVTATGGTPESLSGY